MLRLAGPLNRYPARVTSAGFAVLILIGTAALLSPGVIQEAKRPLSVIDSLFMTTSAVCVTGLSVRSLASDFTAYGQFLILLMVQIGGLGIMTLTTFVLLASGVRGGLRHHLLISATVAGETRLEVWTILTRVFLATLLTEAIGCVVLFLRFSSLPEMGFAAAAWNAVFLAVSAYCNAGFALDDRSLIPYQNDPFILGTISALIVTGGIGYPVLFDLGAAFRRSRWRFWDDLHMHSKMMLLGSAALLVGGFATILLLEWNNDAFVGEPVGGRLAIAAFQSVTTRTAGFNSVDLTRLGNATILVIMMLMFVGGGACSTAGGVKVTTMYMLLAHAYSRFRGRQNVSVFRRTIPQVAIDRAMATLVLSVAIAVFACVLLLSTEQLDHSHRPERLEFLQTIFHVVSALGTVGLAISDTGALTAGSKLGLVILMFVGRLGPISFFSALATLPAKGGLQYAPEEPITG